MNTILDIEMHYLQFLGIIGLVTHFYKKLEENTEVHCLKTILLSYLYWTEIKY